MPLNGDFPQRLFENARGVAIANMAAEWNDFPKQTLVYLSPWCLDLGWLKDHWQVDVLKAYLDGCKQLY